MVEVDIAPKVNMIDAMTLEAKTKKTNKTPTATTETRATAKKNYINR